ncbi:MAG: SAM-dependent methyltransferase [Hoeflea sp.]|nr:SAM-dependent methyltransferase [Hoeflea sp.]
MAPTQLSSGDLIADRRADYARMLAESGNPAAAADLQSQALELAPGWAAGWHELGNYLEAAGDMTAAAEAWRKVLVLTPTDVFGAGLKLALAGQSAMPEAPPSEYVAQLFDDYSDRFDTALVEKLGYSVPEQLSAMVADAAGADFAFARAIDLGCGTGLFGERLRPHVSWLEGYDLSAGMLAKARTKGLYDVLEKADIRFGLPTSTEYREKADLVAAADVFGYFGELRPLFELAASLTATGGLLAFSLEAGADDCEWQLQTSLRYRHGEPYVRRLLDETGFEVIAIRRETIRRDGNDLIGGLLVTARRIAAERSMPAVETTDAALSPVILHG